MPTPEVLERFIAKVESNDHVGAIEQFYAPHASMQENERTQRVGRANLMAVERDVLARMRSVRSQCVRPAFVNGDYAVIRWVFEFETLEGVRSRLDELAYQRWEGDRVVEEKFFYDSRRPEPQP